MVRIDRQFAREVTDEAKNIMVRGFFADPEFFEVFNFPLIKGSGKEAISQPRTIVLTEQTAVKLFGEAEAVGQVITLSDYGEFTVTGVLQPLQGPTHFEFEAIASVETFFALEKEGVVRMRSDDFRNYYTGYAYLKLKKGITSADVEAALDEIFNKNYSDVKYETRDKGYRFYLQELGAITPGPILSNNMGNGMPELLLVFMSVLAGIDGDGFAGLVGQRGKFRNPQLPFRLRPCRSGRQQHNEGQYDAGIHERFSSSPAVGGLFTAS
jgi:putative ABC transport system permease protein